MGHKGTAIVILWSILQGCIGEMCSPGYKYNSSAMQCQDINECEPEGDHVSPCIVHSERNRCNNTIGGYTCLCPFLGPGTKYGPNCNSSDSQADMMCGDNKDGCYNNGSCQDFQKCNCKKGFIGKYCEMEEMDDCPMCLNNGTCARIMPGNDHMPMPGNQYMPMPGNDTMSMSYCMCPPGFTGDMCQYRLDLCNQTENVCLNGGTCMPDMDPPCKCMPTFKGAYCEENEMVNITCQECRENGTLPNQVAMCNDNYTFTSCPCEHGFYGTFCQYTMKNCSNGGVDVPIPPPGFSRCVCPEGVGGQKCDDDIVNECNTAMCQNGATCIDMPGYYMCNCTPGHIGQNCEDMDPKVHPPTTPRPSTCMMNSSFCPFGQEPWADCPIYMMCQNHFLNGICTPECNNENCLYDGFECVNMTMNCTEPRCPLLFDNGQCDAECQIPECGGDEHDCLSKEAQNMYRLGTLVLDVNITNLSEISENISSEALFLSKALPFRLSNTHMINMFVRKRGMNERGGMPMITSLNTSTGDMIYRAYYDVANKKECNDTCWSSIQNFARYFAAAEGIRMDRSTFMLNRVQACMEDYFGENCSEMCSLYCKMMPGSPLCDMQDGSCTSGCKNISYVGKQCDVMCSLNCLARSCNNDGTCNMTSNGRCKAGYMGEKCDQRCQNGKYGVDCNKTCDSKCAGIGMCDKITGQCLCRDGYYNHGPSVGICLPCRDGYYGRNCTEKCNKNCKTMTCNKEDGACGSCTKGYRGTHCDQVCGDRQYGENCSMTCSENCKDRKCNPVTGQCNECKPGYSPPNCQTKASGTPSPATQDYSSTVIAVIVVLVILVVVALVVAYILWRRSQGGKYETNEVEQAGLVMSSMNNKTEEPKKNNEYVDIPKAVEVNETKGDIEKAPLIGEGKEFESIDLKTPPADTNQNLAVGGVFDGGPADAQKDPFTTEEEGKGETEPPKPEDAKTETSESAQGDKTPEEGEVKKVEEKVEEKEEEKEEEKPKSEGDSSPSHKPVEPTQSSASNFQFPSPPAPEELPPVEEGNVGGGEDVPDGAVDVEEPLPPEPLNTDKSSTQPAPDAGETKDSGDSSKSEEEKT